MSEVTRRCVACRRVKAKAELLRVVKGAAGVTFDRGGKADGRGAYVCRDAKCLEDAAKRRGFQRSLGAEMPNWVFAVIRKEIEKE